MPLNSLNKKSSKSSLGAIETVNAPAEDTLLQILSQLRIMNMQLRQITDTEYTVEDLEQGGDI